MSTLLRKVLHIRSKRGPKARHDPTARAKPELQPVIAKHDGALRDKLTAAAGRQ